MKCFPSSQSNSMYFLSLTFTVSAAAFALDTTKTPPDPVLQTNLVSSSADPVVEGSMDANIQRALESEKYIHSRANPSHPDLSILQQAVDLLANSNSNSNPTPNPTPNLDQTIPLAFNEVPYPDFLEEICKYPKQLGCCWIQNGQKFCDYYSSIESKECANHQNWRCCDKIDRINFIGINCKKFHVKEPVPKKDEQPSDQQREESQPPEQVQSFPEGTWDLPDWFNWIMFPGATDSLWQNQ